MKEGFYRIDYAGFAGSGFAIIVFDTGIIVGSDMVGGRYDDGVRALAQPAGEEAEEDDPQAGDVAVGEMTEPEESGGSHQAPPPASSQEGVGLAEGAVELCL